jgi:hypothetical protein
MGKQAKRARQALRAAGEVPHVDAKRLLSAQQYQADIDRRIAWANRTPDIYEQLRPVFHIEHADGQSKVSYGIVPTKGFADGFGWPSDCLPVENLFSEEINHGKVREKLGNPGTRGPDGFRECSKKLYGNLREKMGNQSGAGLGGLEKNVEHFCQQIATIL